VMTGLVFTGSTGLMMDLNQFRRTEWARAIDLAAVAPLRIHDMRHTAASLAIQSGADVKVIQRMLGHASAAMTLDRYGQASDDGGRGGFEPNGHFGVEDQVDIREIDSTREASCVIGGANSLDAPCHDLKLLEETVNSNSFATTSDPSSIVLRRSSYAATHEVVHDHDVVNAEIHTGRQLLEESEVLV